MKYVRFCLSALSILLIFAAVPILASDALATDLLQDDNLPQTRQLPGESVVAVPVEAGTDAPGSCALGETLKVATIRCKRDARGGAGGEYGGASLSLFCQGDSSSVEFCARGEEWKIRMGSENGPLAVDCFYTGVSKGVGEFCDAVHFQIH